MALGTNASSQWANPDGVYVANTLRWLADGGLAPERDPGSHLCVSTLSPRSTGAASTRAGDGAVQSLYSEYPFKHDIGSYGKFQCRYPYCTECVCVDRAGLDTPDGNVDACRKISAAKASIKAEWNVGHREQSI